MASLRLSKPGTIGCEGYTPGLLKYDINLGEAVERVGVPGSAVCTMWPFTRVNSMVAMLASTQVGQSASRNINALVGRR